MEPGPHLCHNGGVRRLGLGLLPLLALLAGALALAAPADELSGADKLRVLYSTQFTFTPEGLPLVPVQLMEGQREVTISQVYGGMRDVRSLVTDRFPLEAGALAFKQALDRQGLKIILKP